MIFADLIFFVASRGRSSLTAHRYWGIPPYQFAYRMLQSKYESYEVLPFPFSYLSMYGVRIRCYWSFSVLGCWKISEAESNVLQEQTVTGNVESEQEWKVGVRNTRTRTVQLELGTLNSGET